MSDCTLQIGDRVIDTSTDENGVSNRPGVIVDLASQDWAKVQFDSGSTFWCMLVSLRKECEE